METESEGERVLLSLEPGRRFTSPREPVTECSRVQATSSSSRSPAPSWTTSSVSKTGTGGKVRRTMKHCASRAFLAVTLSGIALGFSRADEPTPTPHANGRRESSEGELRPGHPGADTDRRCAQSGSLPRTPQERRKTRRPASAPSPSRGVVITNESLRKGTPASTGRLDHHQRIGEVQTKHEAPPTPTRRPGSIPSRDASGRTEADWQKTGDDDRTGADRTCGQGLRSPSAGERKTTRERLLRLE